MQLNNELPVIVTLGFLADFSFLFVVSFIVSLAKLSMVILSQISALRVLLVLSWDLVCFDVRGYSHIKSSHSFRKVTVSFRHTHPVPFKLKCQIYQNLMLITSDIKLGILMKLFFFHESVSINKCIN